MQNTTSRRGKNIVLMTLAIGLAVMAMSSFFYRLQGPVQATSKPASQSAPAAMSQEKGAEIQKYMAMLQGNSENTEALVGLGELFMQAGSWDKASSFWQRYLKLESQDEKAIYHYAIALLNLDKFHESVAQFERLVAINPKNYHGYYYLGMIHVYYLDDSSKGKEYLQKVIELNPDDKEIVGVVREELAKM
ncbi:tetratricopeptide repeat protein [Pseudodesulfovibrio indicus]|jgi:tetratricopeptide (TPR) repeat protein|uniref:Tetratricopeptide repeat protein n=2 Tax=Pseudodesulfovibrio indicus TaxID=1716143 RepID=A0AA94TM95_9BACT|nr:tetratricopeptide repeat protein [Pseudodesulfovibrio indicus]MBC18322.1 hypothetical protein [Desulfovibrio sp.]TDT92286.1 tetratricopeptide repeat protein [Pseudodesulfovibrio indicus]